MIEEPAPEGSPRSDVRVLDGRYEVIRELGRGAMGVVYHVFDRATERDLALKLLLVDDAQEPMAARGMGVIYTRTSDGRLLRADRFPLDGLARTVRPGGDLLEPLHEGDELGVIEAVVHELVVELDDERVADFGVASGLARWRGDGGAQHAIAALCRDAPEDHPPRRRGTAAGLWRLSLPVVAVSEHPAELVGDLAGDVLLERRREHGPSVGLDLDVLAGAGVFREK